MKHWRIVTALTVITAVANVRAQQAADAGGAKAATVTTAQVDAAIDKAVAFLLQCQNEDGGWGRVDVVDPGTGANLGPEPPRRGYVLTHPDPDGGRTALVTLALLTAGRSHQEAALHKGIEFLRKQNMRNTYAVALRAGVWGMLPDSIRGASLRTDLKWLMEAAQSDGENAGLYTYQSYRQGAGGSPDLSNSQYGVLGVWYAAEAGLEVPRVYWQKVETAWKSAQHTDGGWSYHRVEERPSYTSMTAAGAATLFLTHDYLHAAAEKAMRGERDEDNIGEALGWLSKHFSVEANYGIGGLGDPTNNMYVHYMLFGYERVGEASGLTRFGDHLWFKEGADWLIHSQNANGSWVGSLGPVEDTSFALLFLARGRSPVVMQKLQWGEAAAPPTEQPKTEEAPQPTPRKGVRRPAEVHAVAEPDTETHWNNRSRDAYNIAHWLRHQTERYLNWQVVPADADLAELREAPILYVASDQPLVLTDAQGDRIADYVREGGLVLFVNEGNGDAFARTAETWAQKQFAPYTFRDLPQDHAIFTANYDTSGFKPVVRALGNGVRELVVLIPDGDVSWQWQTTPPSQASAKLKRPAMSLVGNLWLYVTDLANPREKGDDTWVDANESIEPARKIQVKRIAHDGNWDPEPYAWLRLSHILLNQDKIDLRTRELHWASHELDPKEVPLTHLTGTAKFALKPEEETELKDYLDKGGTLLFDAAGGSVDAAVAFETMMSRMYFAAKFEVLPIDHPIYTGKGYGGKEITSVDYRRAAIARLEPTSRPRLRGLTANGRIVAIESAEDLTAGMLGATTDGIVGYSPASAVDLMRNIVLWSAANGEAK